MRTAPELVWALATVVGSTALVWLFGGPRIEPGALVGHTLGIVGFTLMLATEVAYSVRKRVPNRAWGPMRTWLRVHIFTGIVGPWLVFLHVGWRFGGLAGWALLAMATVVASGFVGRYFYTALPRGADGTELTLAELDGRLAAAELAMDASPGAHARSIADVQRLRSQVDSAPSMRRFLAVWHTVHVPLGLAMFAMAAVHVGAAIYYTARLW